MSTSFWLKAVLLLPVLWVAASAQAQIRNLDREASTGRTFQGEFGSEGMPAIFELTLPAGQAQDIEALPVGGSDPQIRVFDEGSSALIAENDDQTGTVGAKVTLYSETEKIVRLEISASTTSSGPDGASRFTLLVLPGERPKPSRTLALGERYAGELGAGDEQLFHLQAEQGQVWELTMAAPNQSSLDPLLEIFSGNAAVGQPLVADDDGGGNLDARVRLLMPRSGIYTLRASGVGGAGGAFELSAVSAPTERAPETSVVELEQPSTGEFRGGIRARFYRLSQAAMDQVAESDGQIMIEMSAVAGSSIDPLVEVGFDTPLGFSATQSDDDGGGSLNARLVVNFGAVEDADDWLASFRIKASSAAGGEGDYQITVARVTRED